jgi:hypothetical protein
MRTIEQYCRFFTLLWAVSAVAAVAIEPIRGAAAVTAAGMFVAGTGLMATALVIAAQRSRTENLDIATLFFRVPRELQVELGIEIVVGIGTAAARPNTSLALGVLVPVFGLGMCGLWGARHGTFPARTTAR